MLESSDGHPAGTREFQFWTPLSGDVVQVGPEELPVPLPEVPLPIHRQQGSGQRPSADAIGSGLYDYLRQFPDCRHNRIYAGLLRDAYPHFLADLAAQVVMLDRKEVDAAYDRRKITYLKILALLDEGNAGLLQQIGLAFFHLALTFAEMADSRRHLQQALGYLHRALILAPEDPTTLNVLGQIDFFLGDFPGAVRYWSKVLERLGEGPACRELIARIGKIRGLNLPDHPLVEDLERVGAALELCGQGDFAGARRILDGLEEAAVFPAELPSAEFFYLVGLCRARTGDYGGAFDALEKALAIDPEFSPALTERDRLLEREAPR